MKIHFRTVLLSFLLFSFMARAYEPQSGHLPLTKLAIIAYNICFNDQVYIEKSAQEHVLLGNQAMDLGMGGFTYEQQLIPGTHGLFDPKLRLFNWHFYNPNKVEHSKQGLIERSHKVLWRRAFSRFNALTQKAQKLLFLGGAIHLLEDISVPAHVIPVYHGPYIFAIFGDFAKLQQYMDDAGLVTRHYGFPVIKDPVDGMTVDELRITEHITNLMTPFCQRLKEMDTNITPNSIRAELASDTLALIDSPIPNCNNVHWKRFWNGPMLNQQGQVIPQEKYFLRYNTEKDFPQFNGAGVITDEAGKVQCEMTVNDKRYQDFVFELHINAIQADMKLLHWGCMRLH